MHLAPKASQSFRLKVAIPPSFASNQITHSVNLVWVEASPGAALPIVIEALFFRSRSEE